MGDLTRSDPDVIDLSVSTYIYICHQLQRQLGHRIGRNLMSPLKGVEDWLMSI